jgi:Tol biopolymer transport system component
MLGRSLSYRSAQAMVVLGLPIVSILLVPSMQPRESVRSELSQLQKKTGLSLVSVRENRLYSISFAERKLNKSKPLRNGGDVLNGFISQDGTKIAFSLCREPGLTHPTPERTECPGGVILAVMRTDGSDLHKYPDLANPEYMTCWSHDGSKLALVMQDKRQETHGLPELQIVDLATEETQVIGDRHSPFVDPQCWSPDDKQIIYTSDNMGDHGRTSIYDVDRKTSKEFSNGTRPTWSPDGKWIALMDCPPSLWGCKYYVVRPSGNERRLLFKSESASSLWWSPDSRFVAYVNGASFFERTPPQQLREMVRLHVRRLEDNSVDSFADFFDGDLMEFQWSKNSRILFPDSQ